VASIWLALPGAVIWPAVLALPWRPWLTGETLDSEQPVNDCDHGEQSVNDCDLSDMTVLIPARNEAETLPVTLAALAQQGRYLEIVVVDDQSSDGTAGVIRHARSAPVRLVSGTSPPPGWSGKLWALEQGRRQVRRPLILLLDADIELRPGIVAALRAKLRRDRLQLVSLMARLRTESLWEKLLIPAFVYFFKLLYPFRLSNDPACARVAAAAGGCILLEARIIEETGAFNSIRGALIDDSALAARVKEKGFATWIGLTHSARSLRRYESLWSVWNMVARSAFTQLRHSALLLLGATAVMLAAYCLPLFALDLGPSTSAVLSLIALGTMMLSYLPTLRFYRLSPAWAFALPLIGTLYLAMTWSSAYHWWIGRGAAWSGRTYSSRPGARFSR
jgi:hopene-associated glycosyltransferase HpnB